MEKCKKSSTKITKQKFALLFTVFCAILNTVKLQIQEVYDMDIANVGFALGTVQGSTQGSMSEAVGLKMLDKAMEMNESMTSGLTKMMEMSVNPHIGGNIDVSV